MALPTIAVPEYTLNLPSTGKELKYRPFLVKEEKILLIAMESEDDKHITNAIKNIITNCVFTKLNVDEMPMFDLEYIFLRIRAKSVGETSTISVLAEDDGETYVSIDVPLEEIEVDFPQDHKSDIKLTDTIGVTFSYPTYETLDKMDKLEEDSGIERVFALMAACVNQIYEGETIHERVDFSDKELEDFLNSLSPAQFADVQKFFDTMPKLTYEAKFKNPKTKKNNKVTLEGLQSFFA